MSIIWNALSITRTVTVVLAGAMLAGAGGVAVAAPRQSDAGARTPPASSDPPPSAQRPRIDTINIHGAERTRQPVVVHASGLQPRQVLTPAAFARALRRLRELPVASVVQMNSEPVVGGLAKVDVFLTERRVAPNRWSAFGIMGARAAILREVKVNVAGALGAGELASASWQWKTGRPKVTFGLALPSPKFLHGIVSFDGSWERQSYDVTPTSVDATLVREERRRLGLRLADWSMSWLRWQAGAAYDRVREYDVLDQNRFAAEAYVAVESTLDLRLAGDRVALVTSGGWWTPIAGGDRFGTGGLLAAWRSTVDVQRPALSGVAEVGIASRVAPLALWQGAGTGSGRTGLLRAHPLLETGVVSGPIFGRQVAHGSMEYAQPVGRLRAAVISIAGFVDAAQAWRRLNGLDTSPLFVDAGVGIRVRAPGSGGGMRIDVAQGLRGGGIMYSAGWGVAWPR